MPPKQKLIARINCATSNSTVELCFVRNSKLRISASRVSLTTGKTSRHSIYFDCDEAAWLFAQLAQILPKMENKQ